MGGHLRNRHRAPAPGSLAHQIRNPPTHACQSQEVIGQPDFYPESSWHCSCEPNPGVRRTEKNEGKSYRCFCLGSFGFLQPGFAGVQIQAAVLQDPPFFLQETENGIRAGCLGAVGEGKGQGIIWESNLSPKQKVLVRKKQLPCSSC